MRGLGFLLLALTARVALGLVLEERDETVNGTYFDLSSIKPFEIYPGFFIQNGGAAFSARSLQSRRIEKRGYESAITCRRVKITSPRMKGWVYKEATCDRPITKFDGFKVDCMAKADCTQVIRGIQSNCGKKRICTEFSGYNVAGEPAKDIYCAERKTLRQWVIDSSNKLNTEACSPSYVNKAEDKKDIQMALQVNVLDSTKSNRISPHRVFYQLNAKNVGVEKSYDADVGSGVLRVPWGGR